MLLAGTAAPEHLNGSLPADFGFDPLNLGAEPFKLNWYVQAELVHCRFAMLGVAGVLFPELLSGAGLGGPAAAVKWFDAGKFEYFAPASSLFIVQMFLFAWAEIRRCVRYIEVKVVWGRGRHGSGLHSRGAWLLA